MTRMLQVCMLLAVCVLPLFAQYPHVTVSQLQQVPLDSLMVADTLPNFSANSNQPRWTLQASPYMNDTVVVTGVCVTPAKLITYTARGWTLLIADTAQANQWAGLLVRANPPDSTQLIADGFLNVAAGDVITITGFISEFPSLRGFSLTQFQPVPGHPISIIGSAPVPKPIVKNVGDFYTGIFANGKIQYYTGEPFESMLVEFHNLTVNNKVNLTRGTFSAVDAAGNEISEYDYSHFFTLGGGSLDHPGADSNWVRIYNALGNGRRIDTLRGVIATSSGSEGPRGYRIAPLFPGDIVFNPAPAPPLVTTHRRNPVIVTPDSTATISVKITQQENGSAPAYDTLYYSVNSGAFARVPLTFRANDTTYVGVIPKQSAGAFVRYFVQVADTFGQVIRVANSATSGISADTSKGMFFYTVLNRPLTIQDVQYTPYLNGRTPYLGAVTPLSGIITADTAHIPLSPPTAGSTSSWYMQSTNQPWSGIWLTPADTTTQKQMAALRNGDSVMVTGTVQEQFDVTRLGNITGVQKLTSGNPEPAPAVRTTGGFNVGNGSPTAESYEGMVVRFNNVTVTDINPTFSDPNEYALSDGSGAVVVQKNPLNKYSNIPADTAFGKTILHVGNKFTFVTGIIHYSFNQYKFVPRTDADFGTLTGVSLPGDGVLPITYAMSQNYPNPFNPSTVIAYDMPVAGPVSLKVYNVIGQQVATLVNQVVAPGHYTVRFDGGSLSSGVYFYRLQTNGFVSTKKMMLIK